MSLAATKITNIVEKSNLFDKNEHRLSEFGALDFFYTQSLDAPLLSEELRAKAIESAGQTIQIPVLKFDGTIAVSNSRSCSVSDAENTSALVDVTFVTYFIGFTMVPTAYSDNHIDYEKDFAIKLKKVARALGSALDTAAIAALEGAKTQVLADSLIYTDTAGVVGVNWDGRMDILSDIEPIMAANDYVGGIHIVGNAGVQSLLAKLAQNGYYNAEDKTNEWAGKKFHFTNRLANGEGDYATFYAVEEGNVDMLFRYDRETALAVKMGEAIKGAGNHSWEQIVMPYINIPVGLHYYEAVGDQSDLSGEDNVCARKEFYGFSVDVAFVVAYNSALATKANPIVKATIAGGESYARPVSIVGTVSTKEVSE